MKLIQVRQYGSLFKYTDRRWLDDLLVKGRFRIGTLYEYRKYEHSEIGDEEEGLKQFNFFGTETFLGRSVGDLGEMFPKLRIGNHNRDRMFFSDKDKAEAIPVGVQVHAPDCYVFCVTSEFDASVMRRFGYNACVEIVDPARFFVQLSKAMRPFSDFGLLDACLYGPRYRDYEDHDDTNPVMLKPVSLEHQREVRMVWDPMAPRRSLVPGESTLTPLYVRRPKAAKLLRRVV